MHTYRHIQILKDWIEEWTWDGWYQTSGIRPRTPDTNRRLLALIAWEYGPNAAGAFSVWTASFIPAINEKVIDSIRFDKDKNSNTKVLHENNSCAGFSILQSILYLSSNIQKASQLGPLHIYTIIQNPVTLLVCQQRTWKPIKGWIVNTFQCSYTVSTLKDILSYWPQTHNGKFCWMAIYLQLQYILYHKASRFQRIKNAFHPLLDIPSTLTQWQPFPFWELCSIIRIRVDLSET